MALIHPLPAQFRLSRFAPHSGCRAGLAQPTAIIQISATGLDHEPSAQDRIETRAGPWLASLQPTAGAHHWPVLLPSPAATGLAAGIAARTVLIQRACYEVVGPAAVLRPEPKAMALALPLQRQQLAKEALIWCLRFTALWLESSPSEEQRQQLHSAFRAWLQQQRATGLTPSSFRFGMAALQQHMPVAVLGPMLRLGWGCNQHWLEGSFGPRTGVIATRLARNKALTSQCLAQAGIPVPNTAVVSTIEQALKVAQVWGYPLVVKPANLDQGIGVVPAISDEAHLREAFTAALAHKGGVIVQQHLPGEDHRLLVVGSRLRMATRRIPGGVVGDGRSSITALLAALNADPRRGSSHTSLLKQIPLDPEALRCLAEQGLAAAAVPAAGQMVPLRRTANISNGGTAEDVSACVHPHNAALAERAARLVGLDIAGVDLLIPDISRSWRECGGSILEINAQPGLRPHWLGDPERDINAEILDELLAGSDGRIPTAAITGTNGKSTTARMLHHIWCSSGTRAGVCTTSGVWVGNEMVTERSLLGNPGARILQADPAVEALVLEISRRDIVEIGHPCDRYDVAALLNVQDDHVGLDGLHSLEAIAAAKAELLERARTAVVINADDPRCLAVRHRATAPRQILLSSEGSNPAVRAHLAVGGSAVFVQQHREAGAAMTAGWIVLAEGARQQPLLPVAAIPATLDGRLRVNVANALAAIALAWAQGIEPPAIAAAIASFSNSPLHNPGRYNFIDGLPFQLLLDYAHNPPGVEALCDVVQSLPVQGERRLLCLNVGNRHRDHLEQLPATLRATFSHFLLGCDPKHARQNPAYAGEDPLAVMTSTFRQLLIEAGADPATISCETNRKQAIEQALQQAQPGDLLVMLADPWEVLPLVNNEAIPTPSKEG